MERIGNNVLARTNLGRPTRVVLAGHLDTVPIADNVPSRIEGDRLYGCGTSDMKSGDAVMLRLAGRFGVPGAEPAHDLTFAFYDNEEVEAVKNGLGRVARERRGWLYGDLAILLEPTDGEIEAGCQGTLRARIAAKGRRAHSARSWLGRTPSTPWPGRWRPSRRTPPGRSRSTAAPTARGSTPSASPAGSPAT